MLTLGRSEHVFQVPDGSGYGSVDIKQGPEGSSHYAIFTRMERTLFLKCYCYPRGQDSESDGDRDKVGEARCSRRVDLTDVHTKYILMGDKSCGCWPCRRLTARKPAGRKIIVR